MTIFRRLGRDFFVVTPMVLISVFNRSMLLGKFGSVSYSKQCEASKFVF